jgi:hypothetical protein
MNVTAFVMTVCVGTDKGLMAGKILSGIFHAKLLGTFPGKPVFVTVFRVEADNVMMGFDLIVPPVFVEVRICFLAF